MGGERSKEFSCGSTSSPALRNRCRWEKAVLCVDLRIRRTGGAPPPPPPPAPHKELAVVLLPSLGTSLGGSFRTCHCRRSCCQLEVMLRRKILGAPSCSRNAITNSLITLDPSSSSSSSSLPACPFSHSPHHHALHFLEFSHKHKHSFSPLLPPQTIHTHHLIPSKQQLSISVSGVWAFLHRCNQVLAS